MLDSEKLVTARLIESVVKTSQLAGCCTPEMSDMFASWAGFVGTQILNIAFGGDENSGEIDINEAAKTIGVKESTICNLLNYLQRNGTIKIDRVSLSRGSGVTDEICDCMRGK